MYVLTFFLCFVDRVSRYICVIKANLMHYLSPVYFVNQPVHVSGILVAQHQEVYCVYIYIYIYIYIYTYIHTVYLYMFRAYL